MVKTWDSSSPHCCFYDRLIRVCLSAFSWKEMLGYKDLIGLVPGCKYTITSISWTYWDMSRWGWLRTRIMCIYTLAGLSADAPADCRPIDGRPIRRSIVGPVPVDGRSMRRPTDGSNQQSVDGRRGNYMRLSVFQRNHRSVPHWWSQEISPVFIVVYRLTTKNLYLLNAALPRQLSKIMPFSPR